MDEDAVLCGCVSVGGAGRLTVRPGVAAYPDHVNTGVNAIPAAERMASRRGTTPIQRKCRYGETINFHRTIRRQSP